MMETKIKLGTCMKGIATLALLVAQLAQPAAAQDFETKESQIVSSSNETIFRLGQLKDANNLNANTARVLIDKLLAPLFDFPAITRQAVGKHWRNASEAQRAALTDNFSQLLRKSYANVLSKFSGHNLTLDSSSKKRDTGVIKMMLSDKSGKNSVQLEYQLSKVDDTWQIVDVKVENVSLISNYRRQFNSILRKQGVDGLIGLLKSKV